MTLALDNGGLTNGQLGVGGAHCLLEDQDVALTQFKLVPAKPCIQNTLLHTAFEEDQDDVALAQFKLVPANPCIGNILLCMASLEDQQDVALAQFRLVPAKPCTGNTLLCMVFV